MSWLKGLGKEGYVSTRLSGTEKQKEMNEEPIFIGIYPTQVNLRHFHLKIYYNSK